MRLGLNRKTLAGLTLRLWLVQSLCSSPVAFAQLEMLNTEEEIRKSDSENLPEPAPPPGAVSEPKSTPEPTKKNSPTVSSQSKAQTATVTVQKMPLASNSMLGHILLAMAYERDPLLGQWIKKRKRTEPAAALGLIGIYGVTMAQGINGVLDAYRDPITTNVHRGRLPILVPYTLTIVLAGMGLATFMGTSVWAHHCNRQIQARQHELQGRVDAVLQKLDQGNDDQVVSMELDALVGEDAKEEYLKLWHVIHPRAITPAELPTGLQNRQSKSTTPMALPATQPAK